MNTELAPTPPVKSRGIWLPITVIAVISVAIPALLFGSVLYVFQLDDVETTIRCYSECFAG